jgi:predicted phage terminase large subunit-like protein
MYGGAAGGGKSVALLMAALQYVDLPGYHALILRRTFQQLVKPGALLDLSKQWLMNTDARWNAQEHRWTFPTGATLEFGHMEHDDSVYNYQGPAYQYVAYDELTQFKEPMFRYLFSRLRRACDSGIPIRMRAASNPGGIGHDWVKERFVKNGAAAGRVFLPARLEDNPSLDRDDYVASLAELDPVTRAQLLAGDWDAYEGGRFKREWFRRFRRSGDRYLLETPSGVREELVGSCPRCAMVDPAATEKETSDYTAVGVFAMTPRNDVLVLDMVRKRLPIDEIAGEVLRVARAWEVGFVGVEAVAGFWGVLKECEKTPGMPSVRSLHPWGRAGPGIRMKLVRATPAINRCASGQVYALDGASWAEAFIAECVMFTGDPDMDAHDDQVDVLAYAVREMERGWAQPAYPVAVEVPPPRTLEERHREGSRARRRGLFGMSPSDD